MANELVKAEAPAFLQTAARHPMARQFILLVGVAAAVAVGVVIAMWSQSPNYQPLYTGLTDKDLHQVRETLAKANIPHKLDAGSNAVMVPAAQLQEARLKLAATGLPKGSEGGYASLAEQSGFGVSPLLEGARYQHAMENELARSIGAMANVQSARVHLAIPRPTAFARQRPSASASVLVNLYPGRVLEDGQVAAIVQLVAASVPNLESDRVTIVDQRGRLLTAAPSDRDQPLSNSQLDYTRKLEAGYIRRIEELLTPIVGIGGVRAQVVADLDFTVTEQTQEKFNPAQAALRSEQVAQEQNAGGFGGGGVPGALSNQPPGATSVPETAKADAKSPAADAAVASSSSNRATRNYELDKTISHTRLMTGVVKRLSVAVVVDDRQKTDEDGEVTRTPFKADEIERLTILVKDAVGFTAQRGDSVNVMNIAFNTPGAIEPPPETPLWQQPWLWSAAKQLGAGLLVLFLIFGVLRPTLRGVLATRPVAPAPAGADDMYGGAPAGMLPSPANYDNQLNAAKGMATQDPTRVAQVVKGWVGNDG